jgi:tetratricopeptide (TPR) repeat protein
LSPDERLPSDLARWVRRAGGRERVKVRQLRDWGHHARLTAPARDKLISQLHDARVQIDEDLHGADLEDLVTLHAKRRWKLRLLIPTLISALAFAAGLIVDVVNLPQAVHTVTCSINPPCVDAQAGDIKVAVARFGARQGSASEASARQLGLSLARALSHASAPGGLQLDVRGPEKVGALPTSRDAQERLMRRLDAHFLLTGDETFDIQATRLHLAVIGNPARLSGAEELEYSVEDLTVQGDARTSATAEAQLRGLVLRRIQSLADLVTGLGYFGQRRYRSAETALRRAVSAWPATAGKELPEVLLGNALARERRWGAAQSAYAEAMRIHPGYARAQFGLASLAFRAAQGSCSRATTNRATVRTLQRTFGGIAQRSSEPLRSKSLFERASAGVCLAQAGLGDGFRHAQADLKSVLSSWRTNPVTLREEAAESYGLLGFIARPERGAKADPAELLRAARYYRRAAQLALDESRRSLFSAEEADLRRHAVQP